ncbi:MAG: hypothetical protein CL607_21180 [Anaerolineaceae bacterium]|nr:hypothetical protein [Anaerolineaceae bacterium]
MAVYVERMTNEVAFFDGDLPYTDQQIEKLVNLIMARMKEKERQAAQNSAATTIRQSAMPHRGIQE